MNTLNQAIANSYREYILYGARSTKKLIPLHSFIAETTQNQLGSRYRVNSYGFGQGKEDKIEGKLYDKKVDISIMDTDNNRCGAISVKFVTSNYRQNAINYIENLLGETFNIRSKYYVYAHMLIIKNPIPYLGNNKQVKSVENITAERIDKYRKLIATTKKQFSIPDLLFFKMIDTGDSKIYHNMISSSDMVNDGISQRDILKAIKITDCNISAVQNIKQETLDFYESHSNFEEFINQLVHLIRNK